MHMHVDKSLSAPLERIIREGMSMEGMQQRELQYEVPVILYYESMGAGWRN